MKKMVAALTTGIIITGTAAASSVAAADYTVQSGDTLWNIAVQHNTTVDKLINNNKLNGTIIYPNQVLDVDGAAAPSAKSNAGYKVKAGDTLFKIAKANGTTVASLKQWNNLSGDLIVAGQTLYLEAGHVQVKAAQKVVQPQSQKPQTSAAPAQQSAKPTVQQTAAPQQDSSVQGKKITVSSTAYTADCAGCSGVTATGINLKSNRSAKVIAVDPSVIPLGSKVYVPGYGTAIAGDTGGAIKGNKIDLHVPSKGEAYNWGRRTVTVTILD